VFCFLTDPFFPPVISAGGLTTSFTAAATSTGTRKSGDLNVYDTQAYFQAVGVALAGVMGGAILL
jgi:hypothetical protein